jgi:disulfide oxidoreductase YuzD
MCKNLITNPITGKIIQKTKLTSLSIIRHNFFLTHINITNKVIKKPKKNIKPNITDDEYFQKFILTSE